MICKIIVVLCAVGSAWAIEDLSFPPGFKFGVASAAFQVEGAWNVSDKGESIWDRFIKDNPGKISDGSNGEVACDSYHLWRRDIEMIEEVGAHFYRFSISWPRLLPTGFPNKISEDGARYYSDLIDGLLEKGIEPFITLYHWDLPQSLQDLGGWTNPLVADWFADYARVVFSLYADRVKSWVTINEPVVVCDIAYNHGTLAPGIIDPEVGTFLCMKNILIAHAKAWRIYDEEFRPQYHGKMSIANHLMWFEPATPEDEELAELAREYMGGLYSHPIYSAEGGWPPSMEKAVGEYSQRLGYAETNLPPFTAEEINLVKGTFDFYAMNHYTSRVIRPAREGEPMRPYPFGDAPCINGILSGHTEWQTTQSSWFYLNPEGMRAQLAWLKKQYGNLNIIITENGYPNTGGLRDHDRISFYKTYLTQLLLSIKEDGVNVTGYTAWTLMDNFEWFDGYSAVGSAWAIEDLSFPPGFKFGVASAAFQVEGAWNVSDKGESIWDRFIKDKPDKISDGSNGEVACDSYHLWRRDIEMIEEVGAHFYRFSISWNRLLPTGFPNKISEDGARYYSDLIDGLLEKGIEPFITINHFDLPQSLQDLGGWTNPLIADWFADYSRVVFSLYADRVKTWVTINEPVVVCDAAYNDGTMAPGIIDPEVGTFLCMKNILIAHAKAWRVYDEEFRPQYHGKVSIANHLFWFEPATPEDAELAELAREYMGGLYSHPIYSAEGGWPPSMEKALAEYSLRLGYAETNLPPFTAEEIKLVKGTFDFYAMNHYTSRVIRPAREGESMRPYPFGDAPCINGILSGHTEWQTTQSSWFYLNPGGMRAQLAWLKKHYGNLNIIITENGYPNTGGLRDHDRISFYKTYLTQLLLSIKEDGVNVTGYTAWTLMDNFEWFDGYSSKFGLYEVGFNSASPTRTPRSSSKFYSSIIKAHSLEVDTNVL